MALGDTAAGRKGLPEFITNLAIRTIICFALMVPYRWRVPLAGWIVSRIRLL